MEVPWQRQPLAAEEAAAAVADARSWQDATVKTLLKRLLNKGAIRAGKDGRRYPYAPVLARAAVAAGAAARAVMVLRLRTWPDAFVPSARAAPSLNRSDARPRRSAAPLPDSG